MKEKRLQGVTKAISTNSRSLFKLSGRNCMYMRVPVLFYFYCAASMQDGLSHEQNVSVCPFVRLSNA